MENYVKIMISLPMAGKTDEQIKRELERITVTLTDHFQNTEGRKTEILPSYQPEAFDKEQRRDKIKNIPAFFLGKSISIMAESDVVFFAKGWEKARGCKIEQQIALAYDIPMLFEHDI